MFYHPLNRALFGRSFTFHPPKRCLLSRPFVVISSFIIPTVIPNLNCSFICGRRGGSELGNPIVVRALRSERVSVRTECLCSDIEPLWPIATKETRSAPAGGAAWERGQRIRVVMRGEGRRGGGSSRKGESPQGNVTFLIRV